MEKYISILRGINVSGQKKIKMEDLMLLYEALNFTNIKTYIQSGNIVFCSSSKNQKEIGQKIEEKIFKEYNFYVPVIVLLQDKLKEIISNNPFINNNEVDISKLYITILKSLPGKSWVIKLLDFECGDDQFIIEGNTVYLFCPNGYGRTKLTNNFFENKLKVTATTRNWKTINKLFKIAYETICNENSAK